MLITGQGETEEEAEQDHDNNLKNLFERCREKNSKLNKAKFSLKCEEVTFIGHVLTKDGVKVDPKKAEAILKMKKPEDVAGVQRLVGMVKYLSKFLENLSDICEPLRKLTHKGVEWNWSKEQDEAFSKIKELITTAPVLKYYHASEPVEGQGDASATGLGFVLIQNDHPVTYASRTLTKAERNYSQIEKELLAQMFGLENNHHYVYGRKITLWTDHKPLVSISKKPLCYAPKRLQRLLLRLQQYDAEICYKPGPQMYLADTLSRAAITGYRSEVEEEVESIHAVDYLPISEPQVLEIREETSRDETLQMLKDVILQGWPEKRHSLPISMHAYWNIRDELTVQNGIIFKGLRCVIPSSLRAHIKAKLHSSHIGIQSCLRRARELVYWPAMNKEISEYIAACDVCNSYHSKQQKEPLMNHEVPDRPWEKVGCDLLEHDGKDFLITVDYFSSYFEVDNLTKKSAQPVIQRLKRHFSNHGIPDQFFSDNGPPYNSVEFAKFANDYGFSHDTSSPGYPQSNGKVENAVKTAKMLMEKCKESGTDFYMALLDWRNTPSEGLMSSPAQRMFGRRFRTCLPTAKRLLKPQLVTDVKPKLESMKERQAKYYDQHAKELPQLKTGDTVRIQPGPSSKSKQWVRAQVNEEVAPRSFRVKTEDGREYRRNRRHLKKTSETFVPEITDLADSNPTEESKPVEEPREPEPTPAVEVPEQRPQRVRRPPNYLKDYYM